MLCKICGITNLKDAESALLNGADYIGLYLHKDSTKRVSDEVAQCILGKLQAYKNQIVGIFNETPIQEIATRAKAIGLTHIQLNAPKTEEELSPLDNHMLFLVHFIASQGQYESPNYSLKDGYWVYCGEKNNQPASFDWNLFFQKESGPFFVAGELSLEQLEYVHDRFSPDGIEVDTSVCLSGSSDKDPEKVKAFIEKAHSF